MHAINADFGSGLDYAIGQSKALPASSATSGHCKQARPQIEWIRRQYRRLNIRRLPSPESVRGEITQISALSFDYGRNHLEPLSY